MQQYSYVKKDELEIERNLINENPEENAHLNKVQRRNKI